MLIFRLYLHQKKIVYKNTRKYLYLTVKSLNACKLPSNSSGEKCMYGKGVKNRENGKATVAKCVTMVNTSKGY